MGFRLPELKAMIKLIHRSNDEKSNLKSCIVQIFGPLEHVTNNAQIPPSTFCPHPCVLPIPESQLKTLNYYEG